MNTSVPSAGTRSYNVIDRTRRKVYGRGLSIEQARELADTIDKEDKWASIYDAETGWPIDRVPSAGTRE